MSHEAADLRVAQLVASALEKNLRALVQGFAADFAAGLTTRSQGSPTLSGEPNGLRASDMMNEYERINAAAMSRKSSAQLHKWRTARATSVARFIDAIGYDPLLRDLTLGHGHRFYDYWQERVVRGEVRINSANRLMRNVSGLYSAIQRHHRLAGPSPFENMRLKGGREGKRLAYEPEFIQECILANSALSDLNPEARRIVYLICETGLRPSEACTLNAGTIHLDTSIPYVRVEDDGRETKTPGSIRSVPLVGVALAAMRLQPDGFPRYRHRADRASAAINKLLKAKGLRPGGKMQTLYSLRHSLVDRLKAVEAPQNIQEDILGHVHQYGQGTLLEHRHRWLQRIAFDMPLEI